MESKNTFQGFILTEDETELVSNTDRSSQQVPCTESRSEDIESSGSVGVSEEERSDEWFVGWMTTHSTPDQGNQNPVRCLPSDRSPKLKRDPLKQIKCLDPNTRRKSGIKKSVTWHPRGVTSEDKSKLRKCFSDAISIQSALNRQEESERNLIGDFSRPCQLPVVQNTKHSDLNVITHETMASILNNGYPEISENYMVVDCRYPYEFEGGHIQGAQNIYKREDIIKNLLESDQSADRRNTILIFHCEFSAERGPTLLRHLRNVDRNLHTQDYPSLEYPEIYLLEGGYKNFFEHHSELCCPRGYKQMTDEQNSADLTFYRSQTRLHKRVSSRSIKTTPYERDTTRANLMDQIQTTKVSQKGSTLFL